MNRGESFRKAIKIIQFDLIQIDKMYRGPVIEIIVYIPDIPTLSIPTNYKITISIWQNWQHLL